MAVMLPSSRAAAHQSKVRLGQRSVGGELLPGRAEPDAATLINICADRPLHPKPIRCMR